MRQRLTPSGREGPYSGGSPGMARLSLPAPRPPLCLRHATSHTHGHLPTARTGLAGHPAPWGQAQRLVSPTLPVMDNGGLGKAQQQNKHRVIPLLHPKQASDNHQLWEFTTRWTRRLISLEGFFQRPSILWLSATLFRLIVTKKAMGTQKQGEKSACQWLFYHLPHQNLPCCLQG